ncbi:MAG: biopolymer transporter ExbD [Desulfuromonas sp.]|mgnify:CR=1 FL=1|nr:MAG: biopolymer transporter ExbD [Desulfuromonas sp.]
MDDKGFESINVIPFIDIMLVLLTIVLITSTFIVTGAMDIQLPKASATPQMVSEGIVLELSVEGELTLNQVALDFSNLDQQLAAYPKQTPVLIRADAGLPLQKFVSVMDKVQSFGFRKLTLQTRAL